MTPSTRTWGALATAATAATVAVTAAACAPAGPAAGPDRRGGVVAGAVEWVRLPPLPDPEGFAGTFAGETGGALLVAGGANFPGRRPWEGGTKVWYDAVFLLERPAGPWRAAARLPRPTAYGVSVTTADGVVCAGGGDAERHFRDTYRLRRDGARVVVSPLPDLPGPCAFTCGALVGQTLYVAGGIDRPAAPTCLRTLWALDLADAALAAPTAAWRELEPCPGPERMLSVAGSAGGSFYLFGGARLVPGPGGKPVREYLRDAWRFTPGRGWARLADMPRPAVAAPSPAPVAADGRLLLVSGDDGANVGFRPEDRHPGFPRSVLAFDPATGAWATLDAACPISRATVPTAPWRGMTVIPAGEARPGYRTPEVWALRPVGR